MSENADLSTVSKPIRLHFRGASCPPTANMAECLHCGKQLGADNSSGDFCAECASKIRSEMSLGFQLKRVWTQWRQRLAPPPRVTLILIAVNVVVYGVIACQIATGRGEVLQSMLEMNGVRVIHGEWWRLLTAAFVQVQLPHLISNVVALCLLGWVAERWFARLGLLIIWLAGGIAGSVAELLMRGPRITALGSSGALFGLIGALLGVLLSRSGEDFQAFSLLVACLAVDFDSPEFPCRADRAGQPQSHARRRADHGFGTRIHTSYRISAVCHGDRWQVVTN